MLPEESMINARSTGVLHGGGAKEKERRNCLTALKFNFCLFWLSFAYRLVCLLRVPQLCGVFF